MKKFTWQEQLRCAWKYGWNVGFCELCQQRTVFVRHGEWDREQNRCCRCSSIPRWRAIYHVLQSQYPEWRQLIIHESSPGGGASDVIQAQCERYEASHFFPKKDLGAYFHGFRNENLEQMTLADNSVDIFISQDVLEHIMNPTSALKELARILKPGGAHIFTIPWKPHLKTEARAELRDGEIVHLKPEEYHGNPISEKGSLVVTDWGSDTVEKMDAISGLCTEVVSLQIPDLGIKGDRLEVFVSRKPSV